MNKLVFLFLILSPSLQASDACKDIFREFVLAGQFFHQKDKQFYKQNFIQISAKKDTRKEPAHLIANWFELLEAKIQSYKENPENRRNAFNTYIDQYTIKAEDVPESYYKSQKRLARNRGYGDVEFTEPMKLEMARTLINDQRTSLENWLTYLTSDYANQYTTWAKYWIFKSVLDLGKFDYDKASFEKRSKLTVAPFADLNREALSLVVEAFVQKITKQKITLTDPEFLKLLEATKFGDMYGYQLKKIQQRNLEIAHLRKNVDGKWLVYEQGSDPLPLVNSLAGKNTGWCTAGEHTARTQLSSGDFHVFYSLDDQGQPSIPRLAIRMEGSSIAEVRGVGSDQNLDSIIAGTNVLSDKLLTFGEEGKVYLKKDQDMKSLTEIEKAMSNKEEISRSQLSFLYEIENSIDGFGFEKDPRIKELRTARNIKLDLSILFVIPTEAITITVEDDLISNKLEKERLLEGKSILHYGPLDLSVNKDLNPKILPKILMGHYRISGETFKDKKIHKPKYVNSISIIEAKDLNENLNIEHITISGLESAENLIFASGVRSIDINNFPGLKQIQWPDSLENLTVHTKSRDLKLETKALKRLSIFGDFDTRDLKLTARVEVLQLLKLNKLEDLILPEGITSIYASNVTHVSAIKIPASVKTLWLSKLVSAKGLDLSLTDGIEIALSSLNTTKGLILPKTNITIRIRENFYLANKTFFDQPNITVIVIK